MKEILQTVYRNKGLVSICIKKIDWDKRIIGYVTKVSAQSILIDEVDVYGYVVKKRNIRMDTIVSVEIDDSYNNSLFRLKGVANRIRKMKAQFIYNKGQTIVSKLKSLQERVNVVTIFFDDEYVTGVIEDFDDEYIKLQNIGYLGTEDGKSLYRISQVTKIRYNGPMEEKISFLNKS